MTDIKIAVKGNRAVLLRPVDLIAGTVGQKCTFYFEKDWDYYIKTITYKVGSTILGSYKINGNTATVPTKVLRTAGLPLEIGITGRSINGLSVIPTSWCLIGNIQQGALVYGSGEEEEDTPNGDVIYDGGSFDDDSDSSGKDIIYDGGGV